MSLVRLGAERHALTSRLDSYSVFAVNKNFDSKAAQPLLDVIAEVAPFDSLSLLSAADLARPQLLADADAEVAYRSIMALGNFVRVFPRLLLHPLTCYTAPHSLIRSLGFGRSAPGFSKGGERAIFG